MMGLVLGEEERGEKALKKIEEVRNFRKEEKGLTWKRREGRKKERMRKRK